MNRFVWTTSQWMKSLGLPGMAGVIFLLCSIAGYISFSILEKARLETLSQDVVTETKRLEKSRMNSGVDASSPEAQLHSFYDFFPARQKVPELLKTIYVAAHDESVSLAQGEYKFIPGKSGRIVSYQVSLPVKGSYVQIRKFIVKVLNSLPSAALEEISFKRESIGRGDLEAKIRFIIFLKVIR